MKKELDSYDMILGLGEYDDWSYCAQDGMWYEDKVEVVPEPLTPADYVSDFRCEIKVDYDYYMDERFEASWDELEKDNGLEEYIRYLIKENISEDVVLSPILFKSENYQLIIPLNQWGIWYLEDFIEQLKVENYATKYIEQYAAMKFLVWKQENNQVRFVIQSNNDYYHYLKVLFDIVIDRDKLIFKLENIINTWKDIIDGEIKRQEKLLKRLCTNPNCDYVINHFFPEIRARYEEIKNNKLKEKNDDIIKRVK